MFDIQAAGDRSDVFDILLAADFTRTGDLEFRLAQEIRTHAAKGRAVGLVQTRLPDPGQEITADILACLRRQQAQIVRAEQRVSARCLVIHEPGRADPASLPFIMDNLREVVFVAHSKADLEGTFPYRFADGVSTRTHAINPFLRALVPDIAAPEDWLPLMPHQADRAPLVPGRAPAVAWIATAGLAARDLAACPFGVEQYVWQKAISGQAAPSLPCVSLDRLVAGLDVLVVAPAPDEHDPPDTLIATALRAGRSVLMPKWLEAIYGRGPTYFKAAEFARCLTRVLAKVADGTARPTVVRPQFVARCRNSPAMLPLHQADQSPLQLPALAKASDRPLLCLASNGVGVGHLTRLLAIARRTPGPVVFATHAPAVGVIQNFGYPVEYIPSPAAVGGDQARWDDWFRLHLNHLLDAWDPAVVAYDGNHPSTGLINAVGARRDCRLAWIRRGMWANTTSAHMTNARWCDLVIEPGELAADRDYGITALRRGEAMQVNPILLLDSEDLPDRAQAAAALGLNPARPAVLIQLGSGHNRDLLAMLDEVIPVLTAVPGLQIAVAEWLNGSVPLTLWPQVTVLRGFPIMQNARAFDFCISAAGYNAFHEAISFGLPTIFVANRHPTMDDQYGRARFAQDKAAAFEISENNLGDLPELVQLMMQATARSFLIDNCARLSRPNGAADAALALTSLAAHSLETTL